MTTSADIHGHDWQSQEYVDYWIGRFAGRDDERRQVLRRLAGLLPFPQDANIRVLDVGAGYGAVSRTVLETFPNAHAVLHDFSEPMLAHARQHLESYGDRVSVVASDLKEPSWTRDLGGPFDGVVSAIAIHNLGGAHMSRIYADIFKVVKPGGAFLNLELVPPRGMARAAGVQSRLLLEQWDRLETTGRKSSLYELAAEAGESQVGRGEGRAPDRAESGNARTDTLGDHLNWLRQAGFDEAECFYRERSHALLAAYRHA